MASFRVQTPQRTYDAVVERGAIRRIQEHLPENCGKVFVVTTQDVWDLHSASFAQIPHHVIIFPGGESRKRLVEVEAMAEQMVAAGADRSPQQFRPSSYNASSTRRQLILGGRQHRRLVLSETVIR